MDLGIADIVIILLVTIGPLKATLVSAALTQGMARQVGLVTTSNPGEVVASG
jgi:hypothetical protein